MCITLGNFSSIQFSRKKGVLMVWTNYNYLSLDRRRYYFHNILNNLIDLMCHTQSPENILCIVLRSIYRHLYKNVIMGKHAKIPFIWNKYNLWNKTRNYKLVTIKTYYIILLPHCNNLIFMVWRLYKIVKLDTMEYIFTILLYAVIGISALLYIKTKHFSS